MILSSFSASALTFNGNASSGNSGNASVNASGGYGLPAFVDNEYNSAPAYRFTVIDGSGNVKGASYDVFKAAYTKYAATSYHKFSSKQPKTVLKNTYNKSSFTTSAVNANTKTDTTGIGLSLPAKTTDLKAWCTAANIGTVLNKLWGWNVAKLESSGWCVLIEPIYPVKLQSQYHSLTVTEMAVYGAALFGANVVPASSSNPDSWAWISNYTNKLYPNALRIATSFVGLPAASELSARASFGTIVTGGYGAAIVYGEYTKSYSNSISHWATGFKNGEGNNPEKVSYRLSNNTSFTATYGSTFVMNNTRAVTIPKGYALRNTFNTSSITGSKASYDMGTKVKQTNSEMSFAYNYDPVSYKITYNLDGGTNHKDNPATYNILYGVTFQNPTREGYTFEGWYEGNTKVTGINAGANAAFSSSGDLYTKLNSRKTGNVTVTAKWKPLESLKNNLELVPLDPNTAYRENTDVVTSYWLVNPSALDAVPDSKVTLKLTVTGKSNAKIAEQTKAAVVPANDKNLVYFKWTMPEGLNGADVTIKAVITVNGEDGKSVSKTYPTVPYLLYTTPDTQFEKRAPAGFSVPGKPAAELLEAKWWEYEYSGGKFQKKDYAVGTKIQNIALAAPTSKSANMSDQLELRSGYGFTCSFEAVTLGVTGYTMPAADCYSVSQVSCCLLPEYRYAFGANLCRSFQKTGSLWSFCPSSAMNEQHYTPLYFPDGDYNIQITASESWTPAGAITTSEPVTLQITGSLYDDWYNSAK